MSTASRSADVFISHAWEDKDEIARPLAEALRSRGLAVWYDEYELRLGDSLRQAIDKGLSSCRFGIVILSPTFFAKEWPQRELNALLARETHHGVKVLLPVWHAITHEEIVRVSPLLADKLGVSAEHGLEEVVRQILEVFNLENGKSLLKSSTEATIEGLQAAEPPKAEPRFKGTGIPSLMRRRLALALSATFFVLVAIGWVMVKWWPPKTLNNPSSTAPVSDASAIRIDKDRKSEQQEARIKAQLESLRDFKERQLLGSRILLGVGESIPDYLWLDRLTFDSRISLIQGHATSPNSIANFLEGLNRLEGLSEPTLVGATEEHDGLFGFELRIEASKPAYAKQASALIQEAEYTALLHDLIQTSRLRDFAEQICELLPKPLGCEGPSYLGQKEIGEVFSIRITTETSYPLLSSFFSKLGRLPALVSLEELNIVRDTPANPTLSVRIILEIPCSPEGLAKLPLWPPAEEGLPFSRDPFRVLGTPTR